MNKETYPFRNIDDLKSVYNFLIKHRYVREAHLLIIGCNLALRISDLLRLKFEDLESYRCVLKERKTKKNVIIVFNEPVVKHVNALKEWYSSINYPNPEYLFEATARNTRKGDRKPISSGWMNQKLQEAAEAVELDYPIGTHSMRKFWGYNAYKNNNTPLEQIQKTLNHKSPASTLAYIGIQREEVEKGYHDNGIDI